MAMGWRMGLAHSVSRCERLLFRTLLGLAGTAAVTLAIGSWSLRAAQAAIMVLAVLGVVRVLLRHHTDTVADTAEPNPLGWVEWFCLGATVAALVVALVGALAPVTGWDATVAHLALPMDYAREGRIVLVHGNEYSGYPHLLHTLFAVAYYGGGETAVSLVNWGFAALACLAAYTLGVRLGGRRCGLISAAILATAPIFVDQAQAPSLDLAFCGLTLAALTALFAWRDTGQRCHLLNAALLVGSSCGVRHTGYLVAVLLAVGIALSRDFRDTKDCKDNKKNIPRSAFRVPRLVNVALFAFVAALAASPWLIRSALIVGNPVYPFFSSLLGNSAMPHWEVTAIASHASVTDTRFLGLLRFPWDLVMHPERFDGWTKSPGGLILFLGIPGLIMGTRRARALGAFSVAGLVTFFYFERLARYLLPFLAPMMAVAALACCRLKSIRRVAESLVVISVLFGLAIGAAAVHFKIPVVFGLETRDEYLAKRVERYAAFEWVNEHIPKDETMLTFDRRTYFIKGRTYQNDEPVRRLAGASVEEQVAWMKAQEIQWVLVPVTYLEESPGYRTTLFPIVDPWRHDPEHFERVASLDIARNRGQGAERVEVYKLKDEGAADVHP